MTKKAKPILVAVDFSPHSRAAAVFAGEFSQRLKSPLIFLHVAHDPSEAPGYYDKVQKKRTKALSSIEDKAKEAMKAFLESVRIENPDLKATLEKAGSSVVIGLPVSRILEVIEQLEPSMVVMGSQGRTGLARLYLGSKAEQVVRLSPAPVTIVKTANS